MYAMVADQTSFISETSFFCGPGQLGISGSLSFGPNWPCTEVYRSSTEVLTLCFDSRQSAADATAAVAAELWPEPHGRGPSHSASHDMTSLIRAFMRPAFLLPQSAITFNISNHGLRHSVVQPLGQKKGVVAEVWMSCSGYQATAPRPLVHT